MLDIEENRKVNLIVIPRSSAAAGSLISNEQRLVIVVFSIASIIFAIILFYINKINYNEKVLKDIKLYVDKISYDLKERFNYMKELLDIKMNVEMLKKKRQVYLLNLSDSKNY